MSRLFREGTPENHIDFAAWANSSQNNCESLTGELIETRPNQIDDLSYLSILAQKARVIIAEPFKGEVPILTLLGTAAGWALGMMASHHFQTDLTLPIIISGGGMGFLAAVEDSLDSQNIFLFGS